MGKYPPELINALMMGTDTWAERNDMDKEEAAKLLLLEVLKVSVQTQAGYIPPETTAQLPESSDEEDMVTEAIQFSLSHNNGASEVEQKMLKLFFTSVVRGRLWEDQHGKNAGKTE